ncbi:hypothetical protein I8748_30135 [Nostoc sp. CENA67]|uniref:Uncharacterized protein n=1 Tax=Amazonocrinis nigriterrae CENA67 TaxID=2794033 RepID=A0A8J7I1J5_9NOST|nr:hypothetical protein [Amazonocrinis nigriterrae CENA67]
MVLLRLKLLVKVKFLGLTQHYTPRGAIHQLPLHENKGFGYQERRKKKEMLN